MIAISREFGSGRHSIAAAAAGRLGISCYDRALVEQAAGESGVDPHYMENQGKYASSFPFFQSGGSSAQETMNGMNADEDLWCVSDRPLELAEKGPRVIGEDRCVDLIAALAREVLCL